MILLLIAALIIVMYTMLSSLYKRTKKEKELNNIIELNLRTYLSYGNFVYTIILSIFVGYMLYDSNTNTLNIESLLIVVLILIIGIYKFITQIFYNPIFSDEGILFYNGLFVTWNNIMELEGESKKENGDVIALIGGKVNFRSYAREKIIIPKASINKFEVLINNKTNLNK